MIVNRLKIVLGLILILTVFSYGPGSALAQQGDSESNIQNLILNGGFEGGFQEDFGIGYGWGGFSNGNATVGWNYDDWADVVVEGTYAQSIEIKEALELDRYAGIYQTISVVPGEQYKLTIKGLIRSTEGDIESSDYGYRLQYAVDYNGGTAWELVKGSQWVELPWDEQPMSEPPGGAYRFDTFETTITAQSDKLTLFIRGWKKWINNGSGIFNLDEISFVGPAPEGFQAPVAQAVSVDNTDDQPANEFVAAAPEAQGSEHDGDVVVEEEQQPQTAPQLESATETESSMAGETSESETSAQTDTATESESPSQITTAPQSAESTQPETAPLPVSGQGNDDSINYVVIGGVALLLILFIGAVMATIQRRNLTE